ncbi:hypothetical protein ESA94_15545 [Lacibacter luteus]|uniref:T9SS type A sorting domain-containing protein n=1 Tax=Lacibacter luteus TaxID=2508719 RepID=A0A4Q1CFM6_9BACT|nr:hypothetical protein [Lacibacter luteus]RXK58803.1 hypothetical protein ESA94_15545 [Lacibacter luteus]
MKKLSLLSSLLLVTIFVFAQNDTLPKFTAIKKRTGEIVLSWNSPYKNVSQINIQRSKDSLRSFSTIHSVPNPNAKSYSYIDKTAKNDSGYYRIFILFEGTNYIFTPSRKLFIDTSREVVASVEPVKNNKPVVATHPKETVKEDKPQTPPKPVWVPSIYVFTGDDGNPVINLPDAAAKKYSIRFMREDGKLLFAIPKITESYLTLDKVNFMKSGWYHFELLEDGKLKEKNKFLITRDY